MRDMIWFFIDVLDFHRALGMIHGAIFMKPPAVSRNLPCWPYHITRPQCKTKLDASTLSFACFTWILGLSHKNHFLPTNMKPQCWLTDCCFESLLRSLHCRRHIHYSWRNKHLTSYFYMVQAVCQSWNQSRVKRARSVTWRSIQLCHIYKWIHVGG
jgi:hypothetical protein